MERLLKYRKQIDEIDEQLLDLFADRFAIVSEIRELKKQTNAPVLDEKRWNEILEKMLERGNKANLNEDFVKDIWNRIHKESLKLEILGSME